ncbi:hypothetical protein EON65_55855 [archaeon]|nr:MAG: hypothetical protein EON65_55855 [archaeon]
MNEENSKKLVGAFFSLHSSNQLNNNRKALVNAGQKGQGKKTKEEAIFEFFQGVGQLTCLMCELDKGI